MCQNLQRNVHETHKNVMAGADICIWQAETSPWNSSLILKYNGEIANKPVVFKGLSILIHEGTTIFPKSLHKPTRNFTSHLQHHSHFGCKTHLWSKINSIWDSSGLVLGCFFWQWFLHAWKSCQPMLFPVCQTGARSAPNTCTATGSFLATSHVTFELNICCFRGLAKPILSPRIKVYWKQSRPRIWYHHLVGFLFWIA